jgi:hypothetical protein
VDAPIAAIPITATAKIIFFIFTFRYYSLFGHIFQTQAFDFYSMRLYLYFKQGRRRCRAAP